MQSEFLRFCAVGVLCTGIDSSIYYFVLLFTSYQVALASGYLISLVVNYFLTIYWTFQTRPSKGNVVGVIIAHLFNLFVVRMSLMCLFVDVMFICEKTAYIPTLAISMVTNFVIIKYIIIRFCNGNIR